MYELVKTIKKDVNDILLDVVGDANSRFNVSNTGNYYYMTVGGDFNDYDQAVDMVPPFNVDTSKIQPPSYDNDSYFITNADVDHEGEDGAHILRLDCMGTGQTVGYDSISLDLTSASNSFTTYYCVLGGTVETVNNASNPYNMEDITWSNESEEPSTICGVMFQYSSVLSMGGIPVPHDGQVILNKIECGNLGSFPFYVTVWLYIFSQVEDVMTVQLSFKLFEAFITTDLKNTVIDLSSTVPVKEHVAQPTSAYKYLIIMSVNGAGGNATGFARLSATLQLINGN